LFNSDDKITSSINYKWYIKDSIWLIDSKTDFEYSSAGYLIAKDGYYTWNSGNNYFDHHSRTEYICAQLVNSQDFRKSNYIQIYPNPTNSNFLNVILQNKSNFELMNLPGQILVKGVFNEGNNSLALNQNITNGFYFLKIEGKSFKVVVDR